MAASHSHFHAIPDEMIFVFEILSRGIQPGVTQHVKIRKLTILAFATHRFFLQFGGNKSDSFLYVYHDEPHIAWYLVRLNITMKNDNWNISLLKDEELEKQNLSASSPDDRSLRPTDIVNGWMTFWCRVELYFRPCQAPFGSISIVLLASMKIQLYPFYYCK